MSIRYSKTTLKSEKAGFHRRFVFPKANKIEFGGAAAFTLIELLAVIAIIAILAALSMLAISRSKAKVRRIVCVGNLRQLGIGLQNFVTDNQAYPSLTGPTNSENPDTWIIQLQRGGFGNFAPLRDDLLRTSIWHCLSAPITFPHGDPGFCSYGYNAYGVHRPGSTNSLGLRGNEDGSTFIPGFPETRPRYYPLKETEVTVPADMIAIGDSVLGDLRFMRISAGFSENYRHDHALATLSRHQGRINVAFCDGHVEFPKPQLLFEDISDAALVRWNRDHQPHRNEL